MAYAFQNKKSYDIRNRMNKPRELFEDIKFDAMEEASNNREVFAVIPFRMRTDGKSRLYFRQEVGKAAEMVSIKTVMEGPELPEEIYYLTSDQAERLDFFLSEIKQQMLDGEGGTVIRKQS